MKKLLKFLLTYKFKTQKLPQKKGGFTLIELLVGLILAFLVITPLLGFMINVMTSDRQEQAKSSSEQEIQTALDYISRDLSQAIFIYDGLGLKTVSSQLPSANTGTEAVPVLVFWKREFVSKNQLPSGTKDDVYVVSLVAYYLMKDTSGTSSNWSNTTRIGRVELKDAVKDPASTTDKPLPDIRSASPGFVSPFIVVPGAPAKTFEQKLNAWTSGADKDNNTIDTLIDYVDQSPLTTAGLNPTPCSTEARGSGRPDLPTTPTPTSAQLAAPYLGRQVPPPTGDGAAPASLQTGSFYACVNSEQEKTLAQVFIRGNSLARNKPKNNPPTYSVSQAAYFPKASIQVQGRGFIYQK